MSGRPLVLVTGLTFGDYLLWNWSLDSSHDVLALIAGLTFPPLALMLLWMLAVGAARLIARFARRPAARTARSGSSARRAPRTRPATSAARAPGSALSRQSGTLAREGSAAEQSTRKGTPARKIAA